MEIMCEFRVLLRGVRPFHSFSRNHAKVALQENLRLYQMVADCLSRNLFETYRRIGFGGRQGVKFLTRYKVSAGIAKTTVYSAY